MSTKQFHTPGFIRMANFALGNPLNPVTTGPLQPSGQIDFGGEHRTVVLDRERERSHYFDGKLLKAQDLLRDQNYIDARLRQAGRAFGAGIVKGLEVDLSDGVISVRRGIGIAPSGKVLELRHNTLRAPVNDPALRQELNRGQHGYLNTGLYLVMLSWYEAPNDEIAEVYPREASMQPEAQSDAYDQGVVLQLLALPYGLPPVRDPLQARADLAPQFLGYGADFPGMPADSLALALLAVRDNQAQWIDGPLVRRIRHDERHDYADRLRHHAHYEDLIERLVSERHPGGSFALQRYFRSIPAIGSLPTAMVQVMEQYYGGFPDHYEVSLVPVRNDDIGFLEDQSEHLPPLELHSGRVERVQILVPLADAPFERLLAGLQSESVADVNGSPVNVRPLRDRIHIGANTAAGLLRPSAFDRLSLSRLRIRLPDIVRLPARTAWQTAMATVSRPLGLMYMREIELSAIQPPQVLTITEGFAALPTDVPVDDGGTGTGTGAGSGTGTGSGTSVGTGTGSGTAPGTGTGTPTPTPTPPSPPTIHDLIVARGSRDPRALRVIEDLGRVIDENDEALRRLLQVMDNAYDLIFWLTLARTTAPADFIKTLLRGLQQNQPIAEAAVRAGDAAGVPDNMRQNWKRLAELLGGLQ